MTKFYSVGNQHFKNKVEALIESHRTQIPVKWDPNITFWQNECDKFIPDEWANFKITDLYKTRALQLREKYDYLILNYSGGMDSWNILYTFLVNNIKLDEIHVKSSDDVDEKIDVYSFSTNSSNFHSEWKFNILPDLQYLQTYYPQIKITISNYIKNCLDTETINSFTDKLFNANCYIGVFELMRQTQTSPTIKNNTSLKIGDIWGIDKPSFHILENGDMGMYFVDSTFSVAHDSFPAAQEFFYYTPDLPQLTIIQSIMMYKYIIANSNIAEFRPYFSIDRVHTRKFNPSLYQLWLKDWSSTKRVVAAETIYQDSWLNKQHKFQVDKPEIMNQYGRTRDKIYIDHPESINVKRLWARGWLALCEEIGQDIQHDNFIKPIMSKYFVLQKGKIYGI